MNLSINITLDGEQLVLNEELNTTISGIINSYIKQKISGVKVKKAPNLNKPKNPHLTDEQKEVIIARATTLQHLTLGGASNLLSTEVGRPYATLYSILKNAVKEGKLKFKEFDRSAFNQELANKKHEVALNKFH